MDIKAGDLLLLKNEEGLFVVISVADERESLSPIADNNRIYMCNKYYVKEDIEKYDRIIPYVFNDDDILTFYRDNRRNERTIYYKNCDIMS